MALCPFAVHKLIPPGSNDPRIDARVAIWHVAVSMAVSLFEFFRDRSGGIESHFYITWRGVIEQYRDTAYQADANYLANDFAVSIETAGMGLGRWNPLQRRAMKRLALWLQEAEGIPLKRCESPTGSGHGYHTMWGAPSAWTPVAKSCPGPQRIRQFDGWFMPWMAAMSPQRTAPDLTRGPLIDPLVKGTRKAKRAARTAKRKAPLKAALDALKSLPTWPRRRSQ